jgi:hypothetical protein
VIGRTRELAPVLESLHSSAAAAAAAAAAAVADMIFKYIF